MLACTNNAAVTKDVARPVSVGVVAGVDSILVNGSDGRQVCCSCLKGGIQELK